MQEAVKFAVVVPAFNEANHITQTLQFLAPWRAQGALVIVVDGGSQDETIARCAGLVDQVIHSSKGRAIQMNSGARLAISDYQCDAVVFVHADTWVPAKGLEQIRQHMSGVVRAKDSIVWGRFDVGIFGQSRWLPVIAWFMNVRSRITSIATGDQTIFMTRTAFQRVGGFPDLPLMEDVQMSDNLRRYCKPICLKLKVNTSGRRWETRGIIQTVALMWSLRLRYWIGTPADVLAKKYR